MSFWNAQCWSHLLPSQACMNHENYHTEDVEVSPEVGKFHAKELLGVVEDGILQLVDVANWHSGDCSILGPEEVEVGDAIPTDQHWRWAEIVLHGVTEAELQE